MNTEQGMVRQAWNLARWQRLLRKRDTRRTPMRVLMAIVFGIFLFISLGFASVSPLYLLHHNQSAMDGFVVMVSVLGSVFILYIQLIVSYQRMILEDSSILLVAPLSGPSLLLFRLFDSAPTAMFFGLLGLPFLVVYLRLTSAPWLAYPLAVLSLLAMTWLVSAIALLFMAIMIRTIHRPIGRDQLGVISSIVAVLILLLSRYLEQHMVSRQGGSAHLFSGWLNPGVQALPLSWFGRSLIGFGHQFGIGIAFFAFTLVGVVVAIQLSILLCGAVLHDRLTQLSDQTRSRRGGKSRHSESDSQSVRRSSSRAVSRSQPIWEIVRKDLLILRRTPVDLANYLFPTAYLLYFTTEPKQFSAGGSLFGLLPVFILILASTMGRVPISSFGTEGEQVWLYLQAPTQSQTVLRAKWLFGSLPTLVWWETLCILLGLFHAAPVSALLLLAIAGLWLIPGAVALTLPFAIHGAAFVPLLVGRRNRYVNKRSGWYILVVFPYLLLQLVPLCAGALTLVPLLTSVTKYSSSETGFRVGMALQWITKLQTTGWILPLGMMISFLLAVLAVLIGRSMALEAWRNKRVELYETGHLDGNG